MRRLFTLPILVIASGFSAQASALETTVTLEYFGQFTFDSQNGQSSNLHGAYAHLELDHDFGALRVDTKISANMNPEANSDVYDDRLYLDELFLSYGVGDLQLAFGRQVLRGGRATLVNPTDYFDQRDYRDALLSKDRLRGTDALKIAWFNQGFELNAIYTPSHTKSLMPNTDSRWFSALPESMPLGNGDVLPITYRWQNYNATHTDGNKPQVMLKLNHEGEGFGYSFSYFEGEDNLPMFDALAPILSPDGITIAIDQLYPDRQVFGFDTEILLGKFVLRAEATRVDLKYANGMQDRYDHIVAGFDINLEKGLFGQETYFALEYSKQFSRDGQRYTKEDRRHIFSDALLARIEMTFSNGDTLTSNFIYDTRNGQSAAMFEWKHELTDQFAIKATADFLGGGPNTFFGQYTRNDRLSLGLEYTF